MASLLLSFAAGACVGLFPQQRWALLIVAPCLLVRMALNAVDGMLAREHDMKSDLGLILNEVGDVAADAALYLPFALVPGCRAALVVAIVVLALISEMTGVTAVCIGAPRRYEGPLGKSDRAFLFGAIGLLLGLGAPAGPRLDIVLAIAIALAILTVFNRSRGALRAARHPPAAQEQRT